MRPSDKQRPEELLPSRQRQGDGIARHTTTNTLETPNLALRCPNPSAEDGYTKRLRKRMVGGVSHRILRRIYPAHGDGRFHGDGTKWRAIPLEHCSVLCFHRLHTQLVHPGESFSTPAIVEQCRMREAAAAAPPSLPHALSPSLHALSNGEWLGSGLGWYYIEAKRRKVQDDLIWGKDRVCYDLMSLSSMKFVTVLCALANGEAKLSRGSQAVESIDRCVMNV